jgi:hypothetical protein
MSNQKASPGLGGVSYMMAVDFCAEVGVENAQSLL